MSKSIGILGGIGPLATMDLFKKIIEMTDASCDQDNIRIYVDNNTSIPDRTAYILGKGSDPRMQLIESAKKLEQIGADFIIMPCNTAHYFYDDIVKEINIPFLNMIEETLKCIESEQNYIKKAGLLATEGTCNSGIYEKHAKKFNLEIIKPSDYRQQAITKLIYDIKSGKFQLDQVKYYETLEELTEKGCQVFILGCTELSVAYDLFKMNGNYVDPLIAIAKKSIIFAEKSVKNT